MGVQEMFARSGLVTRFLSPEIDLPLIVEPASGNDSFDLHAWAGQNRSLLDDCLKQYGGLLFRGFNVQEPAQFQSFIEVTAGDLLEYKERSSPRSQVEGNIYTSTDYPANQEIFLHNENSYAHAWPLRIFFFSYIPAETGGETPIADVRKVYQRVDPAVRDRFIAKGVLYVRNFGSGVGLPWQTVFQTSDKAQVEEYCRQAGYHFTWKGNDGLRVARRGPAVARHPITKELIWFNHATFFHVSTLDPSVRDALLAVFKPEDLPNQTYYGDGTPIEPEVLDHLRACYRAETIKFPWQKGDLLMLDNMLVAHAREPFTGARKTLVGMSGLISRAELPELALS